MFSFFRRRKEADATARRIIDQGRFLGARTPRLANGERLTCKKVPRDAMIRAKGDTRIATKISFKRRYHPLLAEHAIRWRAPHFRRLQVVPSRIRDEPGGVDAIGAVPRKRREVPAGRRRCVHSWD
jgi:hypothetical protein